MARTDSLGNFVTDVANSIREKTGKTDKIAASQFDTEIKNIKYAPRHICFKGYNGTELDKEIANLDFKNITSAQNMFESCSYLKSLDLSNFDTTNVTTMRYMLSHCSALEAIDVSHFNTSNVRDMSNMFSNSFWLKSLDLSNFNTSNVTDMNYMFSSCNYLETVDVSNFNTTKVTGISHMFQNCWRLTSLDLSSFDTSNVTTMANMFNGCSRLMHLDIRNFNFNTGKLTSSSGMFTKVPTDCEIVVKGDTEKQWINEKFPELTNVKTVAEYEASL